MRKAYLALLTGVVMTGCSGQLESGSGQAGVTDEMKMLEAMPPETTALKGGEGELAYTVSPAGTGTTLPMMKESSIYNAVVRGMLEGSMKALVEPVASESGHTWRNGVRRFYYRIGPNCQFWVDLSDPAGRGVVRDKGPIEAKPEWRRYPDGRVEVGPFSD